MFFTKTKLFEYLCRNEFVIKRSRKIKKKKKRHVQKISPFSDTFLFIYSFTETENKTKENLITIKIFLPKSVTIHHSISKIHFSSKHKTPEEKPPLKGDKISPSPKMERRKKECLFIEREIPWNSKTDTFTASCIRNIHVSRGTKAAFPVSGQRVDLARWLGANLSKRSRCV